jgi:Amt family ammonium transporter
VARYGATLLLGKALGSVCSSDHRRRPHLPDLCSAARSAHGAGTTRRRADPYAAIKTVDHVKRPQHVWTLLGAFLVFGMQAGFTMLEAGFCRSA